MSTSVHDYVSCKCGKVSVDGGLDYLRRAYKGEDSFEELSEWDEDTLGVVDGDKVSSN